MLTTDERTNPVTTTDCKRCHLEDIAHYISGRASDREINFSQAGSGPYCRDCATKRQTELRKSDERSRKAKAAERGQANVEANDCPIIAAMFLSGKSYQTVRKAASKLGWRAGGLKSRDLAPDLNSRGGDLTMLGCEQLLKDVGLDIESVPVKNDGGISDDLMAFAERGSSKSLRRFLQTHTTGRYAIVITQNNKGHIVGYDADAMKCPNSAGASDWEVALAWRVS